MRRLAPALLVLVAASLAAATPAPRSSAQPPSTPPASARSPDEPPARRVRLGPVEVQLFGEAEPQRRAEGGRERVWLAWGGVTQALMRGPTTWLARVADSARGRPFGVLDRPVAACGGRAIRRERIVRWSDVTSTYEDGSGEVHRLPGPAEITLAFEHAGEHWALEWTVSDRRQRARTRALERRFFASLRCVSEGG